ncbi:GAK system CofD-like protein [Polycladidibacter stylochi]|uniref:GAK system CofD-like protein n=1 Tax=Polycladidibacter stylochi TaxID=1807766 RepID=UPI00082DAEE9|nr:GAK system CofD-like protein [Pseudovibrio stylochi]
MQITRGLTLPDPLRIARYERLPEMGPRILFFSGGTALNPLSKALKRYSHNTIHLITPFDSGGSSAKLRSTFGMPAIGDLRSRLMALADETLNGHPETLALFTHRLAKNASQDELKAVLTDMVSEQHPLINQVPNPMRDIIINQLDFFLDAMPSHFDLRGASIGNLILAGGYLNNNQKLEPILFLFSKLVNTLGTVTATVNARLHLAAKLEDGSIVVGQHNMTGKEVSPLCQRISETYLTRSLDSHEPVSVDISPKKARLINGADLICYPPGSFHSSLMANLLPRGVGSAIAKAPNAKVYIPNLGDDPEQTGLSPMECIHKLLQQLRKDAGTNTPTSKLLNFVIIDQSQEINYNINELKNEGIQLIIQNIADKNNNNIYNHDKLLEILLSMT